VAAKMWYLKNVRFLLGHPVYQSVAFKTQLIGPCVLRQWRIWGEGWCDGSLRANSSDDSFFTVLL